MADQRTGGPELVTLQEAAQRLSVPIGTLHSWTSRTRRRLPLAAVGPGGRKLYELDAIRQLVDATRRRPRRSPHA